ncbi:MAG: hypothetical protein ABIT04_12620 [Novosphingobium sp.]
MDQLRDEFPHGDAVGAVPTSDDRDEPNRELPPMLGQPERRMQARAYSFWAGLLRGRSLPSIFDCDPRHALDFEANVVLLDVTGGTRDPAIRSLGANLAGQSGIESPVARLSDAPEDSLLAAVANHIGPSVTSRAPFGFESEFVNQGGAMILYRGIALPFSSDERSIDFVLCAVNWKEVADPELAEALHREIHRALSGDPLPPRRDELLTEWADGPAGDAAASGFAVEAEAGFALVADHGESPDELLQAARAMAAEACVAETRASEARARAIGAAFDLSLAAMHAPVHFAALLGKALPTAGDTPPPVTAVARLVLGSAAGRREIADCAAVLAHGHRLGLSRGALPEFVARNPGGLDAVAAAERQQRRASRAGRTRQGCI